MHEVSGVNQHCFCLLINCYAFLTLNTCYSTVEPLQRSFVLHTLSFCSLQQSHWNHLWNITILYSHGKVHISPTAFWLQIYHFHSSFSLEYSFRHNCPNNQNFHCIAKLWSEIKILAITLLLLNSSAYFYLHANPPLLIICSITTCLILMIHAAGLLQHMKCCSFECTIA